jgi:hypothetical protein
MPPSDSAGPAEFSIPFPLDEKPTFYDEEAEIMKLKDGRTALAFKAENAVDMKPAPSSRLPRTAEPRPTRRPSKKP